MCSFIFSCDWISLTPTLLALQVCIRLIAKSVQQNISLIIIFCLELFSNIRKDKEL